MSKNYKQSFDSNIGVTLPESTEAEYQVLADLLANPQYIPNAKNVINETMFSAEGTTKAWNTFVSMCDNKETIDITTYGQRISHNIFSEVLKRPGALSLFCLMDHCSTLINASVRRKIFIRAWDMMTKAQDNGADYSELISMPGSLAEEISASTRINQETQPLSEVLNQLSESIESNQLAIQKGKRTRIPTGFSKLDGLTWGGFNAGNLIILSARPSVGKTAVMLQMAKSAVISGFPATIFSLEMTNKELAQRLLFSTGLVKPAQIIHGTIEWENVEQANGVFDSLPLYLNDSARTIDDIANNIIMSHQQGRCEIAFIDYLGLIQSPNNSRIPLYQIIADRTAKFKALAKQCRIPIVLLCQLNRNSESERRAPELFDLRDSGSIEQDSDIVLMLKRSIATSTDDNGIDMWVRKNRQGQKDWCIKLIANETFTEFYER